MKYGGWLGVVITAGSALTGCGARSELDVPCGGCPGPQVCCDGSCESLTDDPANCGACGRDCQGTACVDSMCEPITLADGLDSPMELALDATHVYWEGETSVGKVPIDGGAPTQLVTGLDYLLGIEVMGGEVYWTSNHSGHAGSGVWKVPVAGGSPTQLFTDQYGAFALGVDSTHVYFSSNDTIPDANGAAISMLPVAGGPVLQLATGDLSPSYLTVDASHVYWTSNFYHTVSKVPIGGGAVVPIASAHNPRGIVVDATNIYWVQEDWIMKAPIAGGAPIQLAPIQGFGWHLAVDATHVYWIDHSWRILSKVPIGGGNPTVIAKVRSSAFGIAVDDTSVYWSTYGNEDWMDGEVMKVTK